MALGDLTDIYQQGNGQAFILPKSGAVDVFLNGLDKNLALKQANSVRLAQQQAALNKGIDANISKLTPGDYWSKFSDEIQTGYKDTLQKAIDLKSKGTDPFSNKDFLSQYERLKSKAKATNELKNQYDSFYKEFSANPDGYENGLDIMKNFNNLKLDDYIDKGFNPGQLKKIYSLADAVKESNGTISYVKENDGITDTTQVNRTGNIGQAIASLSTTPAKYLLQKKGGDVGPYIAGFPTITPEGKTYFNTKGKDFENAVINQLANDASFPDYLKSKGYDVSSPDKVKKSAFDFARKQNEATGNYVKDYADNLENKATTDITKVFTDEANRRANAAERRAIESHAHDKGKWADEELTKTPDNIVGNVLTNVAATKFGDKKNTRELRPSTSLSASNVGNSRSPFVPMSIFDPETGKQSDNSSPVNINGGQVHIKPVLRFNGKQLLLDDKMVQKLKEGNLIIYGKKVPKDTRPTYEELLYGEERVSADPNDPLSKATVKKIIIPVTDQSLDKKFDKAYNRVGMWEEAIKGLKNFEDRKALIKDRLKVQAPNLDENELDKLAFETAKNY